MNSTKKLSADLQSSQKFAPQGSDQEMSDAELDEVAGGIILVSGYSSYLSRINLVALNPQPLPPRYYWR